MKSDAPSNRRFKALGSPFKIRALLYHRVIPDAEDPGGDIRAVKASQFRQQMVLLDRLEYTPITFDDYRLFMEGALNLPRKPIIITFDGGYLDVYENAFLVLRKLGMKAVVFVLADAGIATNSWDIPPVRGMLKLMNEQQILELHSAGNEIGSLSLTHPALTRLPRQEAWEQVFRSRVLLEIMLNSPIQAFSYPYGLLNNEIKKLVADAGYAMACASISGPLMFGTDPLEIRRTRILGNTTLFGFLMQLLPPGQAYHWLATRFRKPEPYHAPANITEEHGA